MACAICGNALLTARATLASSALMTLSDLQGGERVKRATGGIALFGIETRGVGGGLVFHDRSRESYSRLQRLDDGIVHERADLLDGLRFAVRPRAIGEQRYGKLALGIDPQGSAREAKVSE